MRISTEELWVVVYRYKSPYGLDTSMPEEVFTTRESADAHCESLSDGQTNSFYVTTLSERLDDLRDNLRESGARSERDDAFLKLMF